MPFSKLLGCLTCIFGSLSLLSTISVLLLSIFNESLRRFSFRMVVYLQISDFILSFSIVLIGIENFLQNNSEIFCKTQAFLLNYGFFASIIWVFFLTLVMLKSLQTATNVHSLKYSEKKYVFFGFSIPLAFSTM